MKFSHLLGLIGMSAIFTACSDDVPGKPNEVAPDDEINFTVNSSSVNSRTMYGEENSDRTSQGLYWGNYNDWVADSIKIFSPHTRFSNAKYLITPATPNSNTAAGVTRLGEYGLQWGGNPNNLANFEFYGFYPASRCSDNVEYSTEGKAIVNAWIRPGQSPVSFTQTTANGVTTYLGNPDMRACLMSAHTTAPYGADAVGFEFKPLATVLDVTINGSLNMTAERIFLVSLRSKSGKSIVGEFKVDLASNSMVVENNDIEGSITNGQSEITMQPRITTFDDNHLPTSTTTAALNQNAVMKVRFFLIPRSDLEISDLQVEVTTLDKVYTKTLTKADLATDYQTLIPSHIRKVTLPRFTASGGRQFNVNNWMSELESNIYISELSIPGSYNSASSTLSGYNKFQSKDAQTQFKSGIRAFKLSIFNEMTFDSTTDPTSVTGKTLCYGNSGTKALGSTDTSIKIGTVADLFTKLLSWMNEEKTSWESANPGKPFNDFVILCLAPNRYYNGGDKTNRFEQCYEIANSLKEEITKFNASNGNAVYTGPITPNTTIADVAGKIIIHYNASSSVVKGNNLTGAEQVGESASNVNGVDALFSYWNAPEDASYLSKPQLVNLTWGAPPAVSTPVQSVSANDMGWLFYEFNGIGTDNNFVTEEQMKTAIGNFGTTSYVNYVKGQHNIWNYLEIGGRYVTGNSGQAQCTAMANMFNAFTYNYIASGQRMAAPWGMIMMNYADGANPAVTASSQATAAQSPELIRAIIANNRLFPLQRKPDVASETSIDNGNMIIAPNSWDAPKRR